MGAGVGVGPPVGAGVGDEGLPLGVDPGLRDGEGCVPGVGTGLELGMLPVGPVEPVGPVDPEGDPLVLDGPDGAAPIDAAGTAGSDPM